MQTYNIVSNDCLCDTTTIGERVCLLVGEPANVKMTAKLVSAAIHGRVQQVCNGEINRVTLGGSYPVEVTLLFKMIQFAIMLVIVGETQAVPAAWISEIENCLLGNNEGCFAGINRITVMDNDLIINHHLDETLSVGSTKIPTTFAIGTDTLTLTMNDRLAFAEDIFDNGIARISAWLAVALENYDLQD